MSESDRFAETGRWVRCVREDLLAAEAMRKWPEMQSRHVCWLAQQAAEKAPKTALVFLQIDFPRTHDLDALRNLVADGWRLKNDHPDLASLTEWAVEARYPGHGPEAVEADARSAVWQARSIWASLRDDLTERGFPTAGH